MRMDVICPTCKKTFLAEIGADNEGSGKAAATDKAKPRATLPFCTERCRLIDLGRWCEEEFRIEQPLVSPEFMPAELGLDEPGDACVDRIGTDRDFIDKTCVDVMTQSVCEHSDARAVRRLSLLDHFE